MSAFADAVRLDMLGEAPRRIAFAADPAECTALAARFGLISIERFEALAQLVRAGAAVSATGTLSARVTQACVATGVQLTARIEEPFALRFVPAGEEAAAGDEIELAAADLDVLPYVDGAILLGEAIAETLLLALDAFPRAPDAEAVLKAAGVLAEGEAGPFAALKALRDRL